MPAVQKMVALAPAPPQQPRQAEPRSRKPPSSQKIQVTVVVRSRVPDGEIAKEVADLAARLPHERRHRTQEENLRRYSSTRADLGRVSEYCERFHLRTVAASAERRCVTLKGTLKNLSRAFSVNFVDYSLQDATYLSHDDAIQIPESLHGVIKGVLGLDDRPLFDRHLVLPGTSLSGHTHPWQVAKAYKFPKSVTGEGQCVGIIMLAGGFYRGDIEHYFHGHRMPLPHIDVIEIDGQRNSPSPPKHIRELFKRFGVSGYEPLYSDSPYFPATRKSKKRKITARARRQFMLALWSVEAAMDVELVGGFAPGVNIAVYFAPNTAQGKYNALTAAIADRKNDPSIISCSWGTYESAVPPQELGVLNWTYQFAVLSGKTVCVSSGDQGDGAAACGKPCVQFPASSPYVLATGGTHLIAEEAELQESVWDERMGPMKLQSGGGFSGSIPKPTWQPDSAQRPDPQKNGRGVPDVAGKADIYHGYCMYAGGEDVSMGGTSAAAPMWAGLLARLNQALGKPVGYITPLIYRKDFRRTTRWITQGRSGQLFHAAKGWNPCTGWGSPHGEKLLEALTGGKSARSRRARKRG